MDPRRPTLSELITSKKREARHVIDQLGLFSYTHLWKEHRSSAAFPAIALVINLLIAILPAMNLPITREVWVFLLITAVVSGLVVLQDAYIKHSLHTIITPEFVSELQQFIEGGETLLRLQRAAYQLHVAVPCVRSLENFVKKVDAGELNRDIEALMLPLVNKKTDVLGIVDSDIYSLRLFRYNPDTKLMEVAWEKCHEKINGHCKTFRLHWGYAGIAVEYSEVVVIPRTDQRDIHTNFFDGTQEEIALQKAHYKSIILVPVPVGNSESNNGVPSAPVVLAITSNKYDHFTEEHEMIANIYRSVLAAYFSKFPSQLGIAQ